MQTERFHSLRKTSLETIFSKKVIADVWRKIVRTQLRSLELKDLYDHYDFNYNIDERASAIRSEILNGTYKASQPLVYRIEKKFGVCRHLIIPQPYDALVLQVLVENIAVDILKNQPSINAFYSRDKHSFNLPHNIGEYGLSWRQQWKELQKKIYHFSASKKLLIVTDLSNYYDSIDMNELRKVFTSLAKVEEVLIDLIFRIIEEISWKPDYLPYSGRGLPTTNIEGIRLLAHAFLFEIDEVIKQKTEDHFTRWMDDLVIGANNRKEAVEIISCISDMLKSRGLALNLSKTNIYTADLGYYNFQIEANRYIDEIENTKPTDENYKQICQELNRAFKKHLKDKKPKYWDKVAKRFITTYSKLKSKSLIHILPKIYVENPALRMNFIYYLLDIGYLKITAASVLRILNEIDVFDDLSLYQLCFLVTQWQIPINKQSTAFLKEFQRLLNKFAFERKLPSDYYSILWFKAKYCPPEILLKSIIEEQNYWQSNSFLRRQVTAVFSRLWSTDKPNVRKILFNQISSGIGNTVTLANQIFRFSTIDSLSSSLRLYLFPKKIQKPYPLGKFLVLCSVLNSETIRNDRLIVAKIKYHISDPYYLKWLNQSYGIR